MRTTTRAQREAVKRLFDRNPDGETSYRTFRRRFSWPIHADCYLFGKWCGMWVGIEWDGYTHT